MSENYDVLKWNLNNNVEFISNISHELRTPLNIILGAQKLLALNLTDRSIKSCGEDKFTKYLSVIKSNSYRLQKIINNFIDITDIQLGLSQLDLRNYDIINVIKNIIKHSSLIANRKGIDLFLCTNISEKNMAFDREKFERVILNLLSNAIKFSDENTKVNVFVIDKGQSILILVEDQGTGISDDKLVNIFNLFAQADKSFTRSQEGCGTGLAIAKLFVELHRGNISVISKEGEGSRFKIELPVRVLPQSKLGYNDDGEINLMQNIEVEFSDI